MLTHPIGIPLDWDNSLDTKSVSCTPRSMERMLTILSVLWYRLPNTGLAQDKSQPLKKRGALGISWLRVGVDDIPITSLPVVSRPVGPMNRPEVVGSFNNTDNAFLFANGWRLPAFRGIHLHLGGTLKLLYMSGYRSTNAIGGGADVGIIAMTNPEKSHQLMLGLQASDAFTTKLYWNTPPQSSDQTSHTETILPHLKIGIATIHSLRFLSSEAHSFSRWIPTSKIRVNLKSRNRREVLLSCMRVPSGRFSIYLALANWR